MMIVENSGGSKFTWTTKILCAFVSFLYLFSYAWYPVLSPHALIDLSIGIVIGSRVFLRRLLWHRYYVIPAYVVTAMDAFYHATLVDGGIYSLPIAIGLVAIALLCLDLWEIRLWPIG